MNRKILMVVDTDWFFLSHRLPVALAAKENGFDVIIVTTDTGSAKKIEEHGLKCIRVNLVRKGINPLKEAEILKTLYGIYRKEKPHIVHHVTLKMIINGSVAARLAGVKNVVNAVAGLGHFFIAKNKRLIVKGIFSPIFRFIKTIPDLIYIYQNAEDRDLFIKEGWAREEQVRIIKGSGIDLKEFAFREEPEGGPVRVLCATRLLWDKGINEFIEAARMLKNKYSREQVQFILAGKIIEENPTSIKRETIESWVKEGIVDYIGFQTDMYSCIANSHINVLPSYREGLPKSLIEVCAVGRPIVTTNVAGCRDVVDNGINGFLVEKQNAHELANAIDKLIADKELRVKMGRISRAKAEAEFSIEKVKKETLAIYSSFDNEQADLIHN